MAGRLDAWQRVWFDDPRSPQRRMSVSIHSSEGVAVVSLWHGDTCSGTFRLPIAEAARLISALAQAMAASLAIPSEGSGPPDRGRWQSLATWLQRRVRRPTSNVASGLRILK
jgi:hypothetical protein